MSAASFCLLVGGIAALNDDVRNWMAGALTADPWSTLSSASGGALHAAIEIRNTVGYHTGDHTAVVLYALAALVLTGLMLRT
jgi:hypothetical protein